MGEENEKEKERMRVMGEDVKSFVKDAISQIRVVKQLTETEITREFRDRPPAHYLFKIENFSHLIDSKVENFRSSDFKVGGFKWMLSLYPQGNKINNEEKHLSLYLALSESNELPLHREVNAFFKLFVYNQIDDKYLVVQDGKERVRRFRGMKTEWGFDQFVLMDAFNEAANGYLIDDCCVFGAELFVTECTGKGECMSIVKDLANNIFTWNVQIMQSRESYTSQMFDIGGHRWKLSIYPDGQGVEKGKSLSIYLISEDSETKLNAEYILRVRDQLSGNHEEKTAAYQFCSQSNCWGFLNLMPLSNFKDVSKGFVVNNNVIVEVQILSMTVVKNFS